MILSIKQRRQYPYGIMVSGLALFIIICSFLFSSCGTSPSDHPLNSGTDTGLDQATPTASSHIAPVKVMDAQSSLSTYPGGFLNMTISTSPFAVCNFVVDYGLSKPSRSFGIIPRTADANGIVNWHWQVEPGAHPGTWPLTISALLASGAQSSAKVNVNVTTAPISIIGSQSNLTTSPGGDMVLTIATAPSITCTILLNYEPGKPSKTLKASSNSSGTASWTWHIGKGTPAGTWSLPITATLADGTQSYAQVNMSIL